MAETASILCPEKTVLIPDLDAGCSLAASIDAEQLAGWRAEHPGGVVVMYVNTTAEVKALTDYCCTSANAVQVVRHIYETHGPDTEILFGPDMWLGAYVEKELGRHDARLGRRVPRARGHPPDRHRGDPRRAPGAEFLIHPECGCSTSVMEYVAAGDISAQGVHMLSTGGMLEFAKQAEAQGAREAVVATEIGMLHPLQMAAPKVEFIPANAEASCGFMKMITLPKLRDALQEDRYEVRVDADIGGQGEGADRQDGRDRVDATAGMWAVWWRISNIFSRMCG